MDKVWITRYPTTGYRNNQNPSRWRSSKCCCEFRCEIPRRGGGERGEGGRGGDRGGNVTREKSQARVCTRRKIEVRVTRTHKTNHPPPSTLLLCSGRAWSTTIRRSLIKDGASCHLRVTSRTTIYIYIYIAACFVGLLLLPSW